MGCRYRGRMAPALTDRTLAVLAHLLTDPNGSHTAVAVSHATGMPYPHVNSAFGLLVAQGWAIRRDGGGNERPITLTSTGRIKGAELVEAGDVGVPLAVVDEQDPQLADKVRARMGWPLRHSS